MSKPLEELASIFDFDFPNDDISELAPPSYLDLSKGILKKPALVKYATIHPCENGVTFKHVCEAALK